MRTISFFFSDLIKKQHQKKFSNYPRENQGLCPTGQRCQIKIRNEKFSVKRKQNKINLKKFYWF